MIPGLELLLVLGHVLAGGLIMLFTARANNTHAYASGRSRYLLDAAKREAANRVIRQRATERRARGVVFAGNDVDCRWWSDRFGVSPRVLKAAVREVGPMAADVERYLAHRTRS
jgi:hypothetical protein